MSDEAAAPASDRLDAMAAELAATREQLTATREQFARLEPLLRALLRRAPRRAEVPAAPKGTKVLTDEQLAEARKRMRAPRRKRSAAP